VKDGVKLPGSEVAVLLYRCLIIKHLCSEMLAFESSAFSKLRYAGFESELLLLKVCEPNSPSLTRVRIFIFGRTAAIVRMIFPRSFIVML
jgi:hypothetical protein